MAKDTYKGESLGKKIARAWFWILVKFALGDRFYTGTHLILASREGGDATVLKAMGVHPSKIVAFEINEEAAIDFQIKHPDIRIYVGDVGKMVNDKAIRGKVVCAHLDFCSWGSPEVLDAVVRVVRFAMVDNSILSVGLMKGREQGEALEQVRVLTVAHKESGLAKLKKKCGKPLDRMETTTIRFRRIMADLSSRLSAPGPLVTIAPMNTLGYNSGVTPFAYFMFNIFRSASIGPKSHALLLKRAFDHSNRANGYQVGKLIELTKDRDQLDNQMVDASAFLRVNSFYKIGDRHFTDWVEFGIPTPVVACMMADVCDLLFPGKADRMLVLNPGRLAAWRAHRTRGTYGVISNDAPKIQYSDLYVEPEFVKTTRLGVMFE